MDVVLRRVSSAAFVGRVAELSFLDAALAGSAAGVPALATHARVNDEFGFGLERILDGVAALVRTRARHLSYPWPYTAASRVLSH